MNREIALVANPDGSPNRAKAIRVIRPYLGSLRLAAEAVVNGGPVALNGTESELDAVVLRLIELDAVEEI